MFTSLSLAPDNLEELSAKSWLPWDLFSRVPVEEEKANLKTEPLPICSHNS
jgi:hypothetical protein